MTKFVTLKDCKFDGAILKSVREISPDREWAANIPAIQALRAQLMVFQRRLCAYCQGPIETEANGYREVEHVLPKSQNGAQSKAYSTHFDDRTETAGYKRFKYEPLNLVLVCKQCNTSKSTFDPFGPRDTTSPIEYPTEENFQWFHPHYHRYNEHIIRTPEWTFIKKTPQGDFTIRACKLDVPEQLEKRFLARAIANLVHSDSLEDALKLVCTSMKAEYYGIQQAAEALHRHCNLPMDEGLALIELWREAGESYDFDAIAKARGALEMVAAIWPSAAEVEEVVETLKNVALQVEHENG